MTLDSEQGTASSLRTTAAGLEAWLAGAHVDTPADAPPAVVESTVPAEPAVAAGIAATTEPEVVGPVNAAEAFALGLATSARRLTGPDGAELVVDPERRAYYFESTALKPLQAILEQSAKQWTPMYSEGLTAARAAHPAQSLDRLLWFAGLIATPGILGRKLSRNEHYKLAGWPETEREFPKHFRIAKALLKAPATADEIAAESGMPYEDVIDYMNASHAAGRLVAESAAKAAEPERAPSRGSRLMSALNKPLFAR